MARVDLTADVLGDDDDEPTPPRPRAAAPTPAPVLEEPAPAVQPAPPAPEPAPPTVPDGPPDKVKFTMQNELADDDRAAAVVDAIVAELRAAGIRPRKQLRAEVIRTMFDLLETSPRMRSQVARRLARELGR